MKLRDLLKDATSINILKYLSSKEAKEGFAFSTRISFLTKEFHFSSTESITKSILNLNQASLINLDDSEKDNIISISSKGKQFIDIFDKLISLFENKEKQSSYKIRYELTKDESRILVILYKLTKELFDRPVSLENLSREVSPLDSKSKEPQLIKVLSSLDSLNLIEFINLKQEDYLKLTPTGERVVKEQYLESLL
jgi:hypothetical protein